MSKKVIFELKNDLAELSRLNKSIEEFAESNHLSADILFALNLSLEEIVTNVISYGYDDDDDHKILVRIQFSNGEVIVEVEDDGAPFNPLEADEPDIDKPLEDRQIGGLGIHLVKNYMDDLEYKRTGDKNILMMKKKSEIA